MSRDALANEIAALAARSEGLAHRRVQRWARIKHLLGWQDDYRRVFCDPASGELTPAGKRVLADLASEANFGRFDARASDADLRMNEGSRRVVLHIFARLGLGSDRLVRLASDLREMEE